MSESNQLRLRRPDTTTTKLSTPKSDAKQPRILQDQTKRTSKPPWSPSFSLALRILLLVRVAGAMYSNIDDCDEVFNFWEPLHFFQRGHGFQTWEVTPQFAIRSWAYIVLHYPPAMLGYLLSGGSKRAAFFAVRIFLAIASALSEVFLYRSMYENIGARVGRYFYFILLFNAGMWNASAAFLPSSFAMYTATLAFAITLQPASLERSRRTLTATLLFAAGGIVGWPFSLALAIPFVIEELFVLGQDIYAADGRLSWLIARWKRLFAAGLHASILFFPVVGIDSLAYGKLSVVPWNIVSYNIFSSGRGPNLYGTSPWYFYVLNLVLNFNVLLPLALLSYPALYITSILDKGRLGGIKTESSPFTILGLRLAPFYVWFVILTVQEHKEERFMFPVYTILCFNAAVSIYLIRGWMETFFISLTKSPYRASRTNMFSSFTLSVVVGSSILSVSRIFANWYYYHAPLSVVHKFEAEELPFLLNSTGLLHPPLPPPELLSAHERKEQIDFGPLKLFNLTLCLGKEWYRFPGHYLVPDGIDVQFVKSEFNGLLPGHFPQSEDYGASIWWRRPETRIFPEGFNDMNREEPSHYVSITQCSYLLDLDYPSNPISSALEPRYATDATSWHRVACLPFLDSRHSAMISRTLWLPGQKWRSLNSWGDYCLLRRKENVANKIKEVKRITS